MPKGAWPGYAREHVPWRQPAVEDILPNLIPPVLSLLGGLVALVLREDHPREGRALSRGSWSAFFVTAVAAAPAVLFSASTGFKSLGMMFMLTLLLAMGSAGVGLVVFILGWISGWKATPEDDAAASSAPPA
jgi:hypothetical protein